MSEVLQTIIGSSVVASILVAAIDRVFRVFEHRREDRIRREERDQSRADRDAELDREERREAARKAAERQIVVSQQARELLTDLEALAAAFDADGDKRAFQTHHVPPDLRRSINAAARRLPDPELRELVVLSLRVIGGMWAPAKLCNGPDEPWLKQRGLLNHLIEQVGKGATGEAPDFSSVGRLREALESIDSAWSEMDERERAWLSPSNNASGRANSEHGAALPADMSDTGSVAAGQAKQTIS